MRREGSMTRARAGRAWAPCGGLAARRGGGLQRGLCAYEDTGARGSGYSRRL